MRRIFVFAAITIGLAVVGIVAGLILGFLLPANFARQWDSWGKPPAPAVEIWRTTVYAPRQTYLDVKTASGETYRCCENGQGNWQRVEPASQKNIAACARYNYDPATHPAFENLTGNIVDCAVAMYGSGQFDINTDIFVVLDDGSISHFNYQSGIPPTLSFAFMLACGLVLAGWIGMGIVFFLKRK